ncbi:membrane protein [Gordonia phage Secretariat]|uniref:Membrane protein n=1 Tax=Gordonia phage Secretariat TaxID=2725616 RepID=A0A6M3T9P1_9CAUD|nr:membrane protein [Gordonia phage Secretariat]QJD49614.1 membrane protein [Gordonia phage Secretariat]
MNPVKKIKNMNADTKLVLTYQAMYAGAAAVTITAVAIGTAAVVYGTVKIKEHVENNED